MKAMSPLLLIVGNAIALELGSGASRGGNTAVGEAEPATRRERCERSLTDGWLFAPPVAQIGITAVAVEGAAPARLTRCVLLHRRRRFGSRRSRDA